MNADGLSYIDLAANAADRGPSELVNGYWSPGYPAIISVAFRIFRPTPVQEFPLVHLVNFVIFICLLCSFSFFLRQWFTAVYGKESPDGVKRWLTVFAFCTFLWFSLKFAGTELVTPDLAIAAIVLLAAGITLRLSLAESSWTHYVFLGVVLGAGYYLKSVMFPLGLALLVLLLLFPSAGMKRRKLSLSVVTFVFVVTPLVATLSARKGGLTFGEAGRLNYLWYANGENWTDGLDIPEPHSMEHPAPKLMDRPEILYLAAPLNGTYKLWFDPSYWYAASSVRFSVGGQIAAIRESMRAYKRMGFEMMAFVAGAVVLGAFSLAEKSRRQSARVLLPLLSWPMIAFGLYAMVHVEERFVAAFFVLFWLGLFGLLIPRVDARVSGAVCATVLIAVMAPFAIGLAQQTVQVAKELAHPKRPDHQVVAAALDDLGLHEGDRVAVVGYARDCYWAREDRLQVIAQIPDEGEFWELSEPQLQSVLARLSSVGVRAVVTRNRRGSQFAAKWKDIGFLGSARVSVLVLPAGSGT